LSFCVNVGKIARMPRSDPRETVRALAGPLEVEARGGYRDAAVVGLSIGEYVGTWGARARRVLRSRAALAHCAKVEEVLASYQACDAAARRERVDSALRLLAELEAMVQRGAGSSAAGPSERRSKTRRGGSLDDPWAQGRTARLAWARRLAKLGIETKRDLLYHFPRDYVPLRRIADLADGERATVMVVAGAREEMATRRWRGSRLMRYSLEVSDGSGTAQVSSFARVPRAGARSKAILASPLTLSHPEGTRLLVEGTIRRTGDLIEIQYGSAELLHGEEDPAPGRLVPVYPLTDGVYQGQVRPYIRRLLEGLPDDLPDGVPASLREKHDLLPVREALQDIHYPPGVERRDAARRRFAFEELLVLQVALAQRKREWERPGTGIPMPPRGDIIAVMEEVLPFSLTRAQQRVIAEIAADMASDRPMSRLIQGDVGSGKTVVAAAALTIALQNGYQGSLMAPTELLAEQHYLVLAGMLEPLGVAVELLTGSVRGRDRERAYADIASGRAQVVVGTHALIQESVSYHKLGLVIVDEQHRFGVRQRSELREKEGRADMLVMTATPIPRTLALSLYGDLDISVLDELPPGRRPVKTAWQPLKARQEAYEFVRREVASSRQAYVVCPLIEESEELQAEAATKLAAELQREVFPELRVGLLHGQMSVGEKAEVMTAFRSGEVDVLTATTVIEVGVDVPNATVMLILNAERYGLAQLHQLRGRVGRGGEESYCIVLTGPKHDPTRPPAAEMDDAGELTRRRLRVLLGESDGFAIAEEDLLLRGPGEFYGTRQHGLPDFRLARVSRDAGLLEEAREAARWLVERDAELEETEQAELRKRVGALRARMERLAG
jgi:ATP-dependent DNA helicase RecG